MAFLEHVLNTDSGQGRVLISWTFLVCLHWSQDVSFADSGRSDIPAYLLTRRPFGQCILAGTLLETILQYGETDGRLQSMCKRRGEDVFISTTRRPIFGGQLQCPTNGYRWLGSYAKLRSFTGMPNPVCASSQDVVACNPEDVSAAPYFGGGFLETTGITQKNHFVLIFEISNLPELEPPPRPRPLRLPRSPSLNLRASQPASPCSGSIPLPHNIPDRQSPSTPTPSSSPNSGDEGDTFCHLDIDQDSQPTTPTTFSKEEELVEGLDIEGHLLDILECLRLDEPKSRQSYAGGLELNMIDVMDHFGWNIYSYQKKYLVYRWGQKIADASWRGDIPAKGKSLYSQYRRWRGIVWFFQPGGGLDRKVSPQKIRKDPDETAAAELKQTMLFEKRSVLENLLLFH
ncbi:hypothetical protein BDN72DRAFT_904542 [Pluteus cervinus]|uniref:Uncharacterized protein n=1 Tax=Pluteus cervinus TaxID=181527 RepID=A0ACD3A5H7_9AGAR|nr:hypothetical protein BDN72DRAFT_904542 [Pluteus cervinus]